MLLKYWYLRCHDFGDYRVHYEYLKAKHKCVIRKNSAHKRLLRYSQMKRTEAWT